MVLDSDFCALKGITDTRKLFLSSAIIKKRQYWPTLVPGDAINDQLYTKDVCDTYILRII